MELDQPVGSYSHNIIIKYDELNKTITGNIIIGDIEIIITNFSIRDFRLGEIGAIDINLQSNWNQKLNNVYVELEILDEDKSLNIIKGADLSIEKSEKTTIFWDTKELSEKEYRIIAKVKQNSKLISENEYRVILSSENAIIQKEQIIKSKLILILSATIITIIIIITLKK